jgi:hypothetical protein
VEARQVDAFLAKLATDFGHKNIYREDAFARYLMGMVYENQGDTNNAYISYWKALEGYDSYKKRYGVSPPTALVLDALRSAEALGFSDEVKEIQQRWGGTVSGPLPWDNVPWDNVPRDNVPRDNVPRDAGEVVVLHYNGLPPHKVDSFFELGLIQGLPYLNAVQVSGEDEVQVEKARSIALSIMADDMIRMAFPAYESTPYRIKEMDVRAGVSGITHSAQLAEDIGAIARKNLQERIARVRAKTIARAVTKFVLSRSVANQVEKEGGAGAGWIAKKILQVASSATELADKRFWQTVPDQIWVARLTLPGGDHTLKLTFRDDQKTVILEKEMGVTITPGQKTFVVVRTAQ